jgi:hypothetical protein
MVNPTLLRERKKGLVPVLCARQTNCGKRQYIIARHAVKSHFYIQVSALNCTTQACCTEWGKCNKFQCVVGAVYAIYGEYKKFQCVVSAVYAICGESVINFNV